MKNSILILLVFFSFSIGLNACKSDSSGGTTTSGKTTGTTTGSTTSQPKPKKKTYRINADSAYQFVKDQVNFGPRVPNTKAHSNCVKYLASKMQQYSDTVYMNRGAMTTYKKEVLIVKNIVGVFNPKAKKRILLAAHYDTRPQADEDPNEPRTPADGANDGASGVGVLLEIARQLSIEKPKVGVDIIFFDAEDGGARNGISNSWCLGSQFWAANTHIENYTANYGILLDMVGASNANFGFEGYSINNANAVMVKVWQVAQSLGHGNFFLNLESGSITDDHVFVHQGTGIPMIDIIDYDIMSGGFGDFWHKHSDNIDIIDPVTLNAVGETILNVVMNEE